MLFNITPATFLKTVICVSANRPSGLPSSDLKSDGVSKTFCQRSPPFSEHFATYDAPV